MKQFVNTLAVFDDVNNFVKGLWESLTTPIAIIIYIVLIVAIIILLIVSIIVKERRFTKTVKHLRARRKQAAAAQEKPKEKADPGIKRFSMLNELDERYAVQEMQRFDTVTLAELCDEFRNFAANKLGLYYDIGDIRKFVAGMAVSKILILQGMSGTGKTSLAYAFGQFLDNPSTVIPVQPMWKERTDLLGYYNEFTKRFNETLLLQKMYEANYRRDIYITILDEMNIARVEYYFAEFLSLLEIPDPEARMLEVVSDHWESDPKLLKEGRIKLPENMWFIGTANNDDSTFAISDKVYDRAMVLDLDKKSDPFHVGQSRTVRVSAEDFVQLVSAAQSEYEISSDTLEKLARLDTYLVKTFHITFGNRIMKQIRAFIPVYVRCGGDELDALDDIITKKVLRKLKTQNTVYVRSMAEEVCEFLDELFGADKMSISKEYVRTLANNA